MYSGEVGTCSLVFGIILANKCGVYTLFLYIYIDTCDHWVKSLTFYFKIYIIRLLLLITLNQSNHNTSQPYFRTTATRSIKLCALSRESLSYLFHVTTCVRVNKITK